jgi:hypothetical protein
MEEVDTTALPPNRFDDWRGPLSRSDFLGHENSANRGVEQADAELEIGSQKACESDRLWDH